MSARISVANEELATVREAMRGLNNLVDDLALGHREKVVLTRANRMVAVVLPVAAYAELSEAHREAKAPQ